MTKDWTKADAEKAARILDELRANTQEIIPQYVDLGNAIMDFLQKSGANIPQEQWCRFSVDIRPSEKNGNLMSGASLVALE